MHRIMMAACACLLGGCVVVVDRDKEDESQCREVKPGTVTTVNAYCAVMNVDPVDPSIVREWNGKRVGFCCKGCLPKWDAMSDAEKSAALDAAMAKGTP